MPATKSKAKVMLETSQADSEERRVRITIIDRSAFEYHLTPYESVARGMLDPDVADTFIEVPIEPHLRGVVAHAYLHTSQIAKLYLHDDFTPDKQEQPPVPDEPKQPPKQPSTPKAKGG
jgi:hypothetical protein